MVTVSPKRFTLEEYHRLGELGFFAEDERVELIRGEIIKMHFKKTPHSVCNTLLVQALVFLLKKRAVIRGQEPIFLPSDSEPQPDLVIAKNKSDNYLSSNPYADDILLIAEISDATLRYDQETKLSLYAQEKITNYWIFNLIASQLETYCEPFQDTQSNFSYRSKRIYLPNEAVILPCFPEISLDLSTIFPE